MDSSLQTMIMVGPFTTYLCTITKQPFILKTLPYDVNKLFWNNSMILFNYIT
jgi:hypothetical protein